MKKVACLRFVVFRKKFVTLVSAVIDRLYVALCRIKSSRVSPTSLG